MNYTGGSGTLNNGVIENSSGGSQLFNYPSFHDPVITLYFDDFYVIDDLSLNAGPQGNSIPGKMTGLDLTIGSVIDSFLTVDVGNIIEFVDLAGSSLTGLTTNTLTLSGFDSSWSSYQTFNISEITLNGVQTDLAQVPEPSILALFGLGLAGFGFARRRKLQS